jgi:(p)ppGpp synthase/HD superfamily hydrolase
MSHPKPEHLLDRALRLAVNAHAGQVDRAGAPYILHVLQVLAGCRPDLDAMTVAALHDVVEDSPCTLDDLRLEGFPPKIVEAVDALTRRDGETYEDFIERAAAVPLARKVKLADLQHNMDVSRLPHVGPGEAARLERYRTAWTRLGS